MTVVVKYKILLLSFIFLVFHKTLSLSDSVCCLDSHKQTTIRYILNAKLSTIFPMLFKFSSINLPPVRWCLMNFVSKSDFFCLFLWEMFTTDTIVYPCEQNQNQYENVLAPVNTGNFTFQKSDWFDRVTIRDLCEYSLR